jgi:hypothetical protein
MGLFFEAKYCFNKYLKSGNRRPYGQQGFDLSGRLHKTA